MRSCSSLRLISTITKYRADTRTKALPFASPSMSQRSHEWTRNQIARREGSSASTVYSRNRAALNSCHFPWWLISAFTARVGSVLLAPSRSIALGMFAFSLCFKNSSTTARGSVGYQGSGGISSLNEKEGTAQHERREKTCIMVLHRPDMALPSKTHIM